jgi:hypothetical protein
MTYTETYQTWQSFSNISFAKIKHLAALPTIDPALISIERLASRYTKEIENTFNQVINAPSNDGCEVTILREYGGARNCPTFYEEERVEVDAALNILIGDTRDMLEKLIREWWMRSYRVFLFGTDFINSKEKIEPKAPPPIRYALQVLHSHGDKNKLLADMVVLTQRRRISRVSVN